MTKQEEIRGTIQRELVNVGGMDKAGAYTFTDQILTYLHSQGVVIKVDLEHTELESCEVEMFGTRFNVISAKNLTATEPLI